MKLYYVKATNLKSTNQYINSVNLKFTDKKKAETTARKLKNKGFNIKVYHNTRRVENNVEDAIAYVVDQIGE